jgi:nucleoside-diphosphate-sugar epimerase
MNILLTGAFGNIGSSALPELLAQGHRVRCFVRKSRAHEAKAQLLTHNPQVELAWGDLRRPEDLAAAMTGQEIVIHLAYILPPRAYDTPEEAYATNVEGTRNLLQAALQQPQPPKFLFGSTYAVFGSTTQHVRHADDPTQASEMYTRQKLTCEKLVKDSGLLWAIYRFADAPPLTVQKPHPMVFTIGLDTRMEFVHTTDAGLALANGISRDIWGRTWLIGGGPTCQTDYRTYLSRMLVAAGLDMLPESAFEAWPWGTDWLDSSESEALLHYQRHSFDEIVRDVAAVTAPRGAAKAIMPLIKPLVRATMLRMAKNRRREKQQRPEPEIASI